MTGSVASVKGFPGFGVYSASKAASRSFARTWLNELKGRNTRLNPLSPGADGHIGFPTSRQGDEGDVRNSSSRGERWAVLYSTDENRPMRVSLDGALHDGRGTPPVNCFRQEHQIGRFLSIFEERLARRAYLRTHGQPTR